MSVSMAVTQLSDRWAGTQGTSQVGIWAAGQDGLRTPAAGPTPTADLMEPTSPVGSLPPGVKISQTRWRD